jgi:apolipoprotein N-acyltransferase
VKQDPASAGAGPGLAVAGRTLTLVRCLGLLIAGALAGLGQAPFGLPAVTVLVLAGVLTVARKETRNATAFLNGWFFGVGYFALTLHWIVEPFQVDAASHGWMAPFALFFMATGMALFWGAGFLLARQIGSGIWAIVAGLAVVEMIRSFVLTGFPWALIGHIWIDTPIAQLAALVGPHGLTLLTLGLAGAIAALGPRLWVALPLALTGVLWVWLDPGPAPVLPPDAPVIRLVQPNMPQDQKFDPDMIPVFYERILRLSGGGAVPQLVVWPETALPWLLEHSADILETAADATRGAPLVIGIQRRDGTRYFNSLVLADGEGQVRAVYDKHHLVPFGEYVPFGELMARFNIHGLAASQGGGFSSGDGPALIDLPGIGPAMPLICYEGIFAEEVNAMPASARLMILITNDAWFGTLAGPYQHLAQGRLRAIEQGIPMVRVANTGISALIDGHGRVIGSIPLGTEGALDLPLPEPLPPTIYAKFGDWPVILLLGLLLGICFATRRYESG